MTNEIIVRIGFFFGILAFVAIWELIAPRRRLTISKPVRWRDNLGIVFIDTIVVRLLIPITPVAAALLLQERNWGLLNFFDLPYWAVVIIGVVVLDLAIYLQHVMFHAVPVLWRLHMMHHADLDFDLTTGLRFHPVEILLSMGIKLAVIVVFGQKALAVIIFEILLNATAMFNHGNIHIPERIDQVLRLFVVTPDMHRLHHSVVIAETNSNFGFNLPWWDRLLGTYRAQPAAGHDDMTIGLSQFRDAKRLTLLWMLVLPFIGKTGSYSINRWGRELRIKKK